MLGKRNVNIIYLYLGKTNVGGLEYNSHASCLYSLSAFVNGSKRKRSLKDFAMAAIKLEPPSFVSDKKSYEAYKRELKVWSIATGVSKDKQALVVALSLPEDHESNIKQKVFAEIETEKLNSDDGMDTMIKFFDDRFMKDSFVVAYEKYKAWNNLVRKVDEKVENFISNYESTCKEAENHGIKEFEIVKAFKLLDASNLEPFERQLVFTGIDFQDAKEKKN